MKFHNSKKEREANAIFTKFSSFKLEKQQLEKTKAGCCQEDPPPCAKLPC
mgnify:CR=1 FL=1